MTRVLYQEELQNLTVADLKADPSLVAALRQLRESVNSAHISQPARIPANANVSRPAGTMSQLNVWEITHAEPPPSEMLLRPTSSSGLKPGTRLRIDANRRAPSGIKTISAPGPGWMGPHKGAFTRSQTLIYARVPHRIPTHARLESRVTAMESQCRLKGPAHV